MATELGLSRGTVRAAYDQLAEEGYLISRPGSGTVVAALPHPPAAFARPDRGKPPPSGAPHPAARSPADPPDASPDLMARTPHDRLPESAEPATRRPRYDLRPGLPDLAAFPAAAWLRSTRRVLAVPAGDIMGLGDPLGRVELRSALAGYLGRTRGVRTTPGHIVITSGFYQSIGLLARVLAGSGTTAVAMEEPGHDVFREAVRRSGVTIVPLPVDREGARLDGLDEAGAVVLTPTHQYPTGVPLSPGRRKALRDWARARDGVIIEDDYDGEFRYDRRPVGAVQGSAPEHVAYLGTTSKTLGPGLRLAWMVLPSRLVGPVVEAKREADLHTGTLGQLVLADLIAGHDYDRHIRKNRLRYARRRELLLARLGPGPDQPVPGAVLHGVAAGLHTLMTFPEGGPDEAEVMARCAEEGIGLRGLAELWQRPEDRPQGILIGYAASSERAYPAALDALSKVLTCL
jgi:GntR family transcriptional regulator/MocR family aminotransferase